MKAGIPLLLHVNLYHTKYLVKYIEVNNFFGGIIQVIEGLSHAGIDW